MSKRRDKFTIDMWSEFTPPAVAVELAPEVTKGGTLDVKIARALSYAMSNCNKSREQIAKEMSEFLGGQKVSENMLNTYASPERKDHKITLERFIALVDVSKCHDLLGFVADFSGFAVVPEEYIDIINLDAADDFAQKANQYRDLLALKVKANKR